MAQKRLKDDWTPEARNRWNEILRFYVKRNDSSTYSCRLRDRMNELIRSICENPEWGQQTVIPAVRWKLIEDFIVYYETKPDRILVLTVWDARQDPNGIPFPLEEK